jgi:hypothetical protein
MCLAVCPTKRAHYQERVVAMNKLQSYYRCAHVLKTTYIAVGVTAKVYV